MRVRVGLPENRAGKRDSEVDFLVPVTGASLVKNIDSKTFLGVSCFGHFYDPKMSKSSFAMTFVVNPCFSPFLKVIERKPFKFERNTLFRFK